MNRWLKIASVTAGLVALAWAASAQEPSVPKTIAAVQEDVEGDAKKEQAAPKGEASGLRIVAGHRLANADARRSALGYTSTPLIEITQPRADMLLASMTGMAAAGGLPCEDSNSEVAFDLSQAFTIVNDRNNNRPIRLSMEAQLIGLFRGNREGAGTASTLPAEAIISTGGVTAAHVGFPGRSHSGKDIMFISERSPSIEAIIGPGEFTLSQKFTIRCSHPKKLYHKNVMMAMF
ncbi:MAG TPA: hypothetical protein VGL71_02170, partial [Urbifossiella sp.]